MFEAYKEASTWRRIGILLAILGVLFFAPALVSLIVTRVTERVPPADPGMIEIVEPARFRLFDRDDDGRVDCALKIPATRWTRLGFRRADTDGCEGRRVAPMPEALAVVADEALELRRRHRFSLARAVDLDGDGRVDCLVFDGTWRFAPGAACPDRRSDARELTAEERLAADRVLELEREIATEWLAPLLDD